MTQKGPSTDRTSSSILIAVLGDNSRAHGFRSVQELLATGNQVPTWSVVQPITFHDDAGYELIPRFDTTWRLTGLDRNGAPDRDGVLTRLRAVLDQTKARIGQNPQTVEDYGITRDEAFAELDRVKALDLAELVDPLSTLFDPRTEMRHLPDDGAHDPGGWLHMLIFHS
jgi:hypothetical protein